MNGADASRADIFVRKVGRDQEVSRNSCLIYSSRLDSRARNLWNLLSPRANAFPRSSSFLSSIYMCVYVIPRSCDLLLGSCRARCNLQVRDTINFMSVQMLEEVIFFFSSSSFPSFPLFSRDLFTFVLVLIGWRENSGERSWGRLRF